MSCVWFVWRTRHVQGRRKHRAFRISLGSVSVIVGRVRYVFRRNTGFRSTIDQAGTRNGRWIEQNQLNGTLFPVGGFLFKWCGSADSRSAYRVRSSAPSRAALRRTKIVLTTYVPSRRFAKWCGSLRGQTRWARACNPGYRLMLFYIVSYSSQEPPSWFIFFLSFFLYVRVDLRYYKLYGRGHVNLLVRRTIQIWADLALCVNYVILSIRQVTTRLLALKTIRAILTLS